MIGAGDVPALDVDQRCDLPVRRYLTRRRRVEGCPAIGQGAGGPHGRARRGDAKGGDRHLHVRRHHAGLADRAGRSASPSAIARSSRRQSSPTKPGSPSSGSASTIGWTSPSPRRQWCLQRWPRRPNGSGSPARSRSCRRSTLSASSRISRPSTSSRTGGRRSSPGAAPSSNCSRSSAMTSPTTTRCSPRSSTC